MRSISGLNNERVRRDNVSAVLREVHRRGPVSRSELAARTGLYRQTIRSLAGELEALGLVTQRPAPSDGAPGRPSFEVAARPDVARVLALDIEVDSIGAALVGLGGQVIRSGRVSRPRRNGSPGTTLAAATHLADELLADGARATVRAVGVAVVGMVRRSDGLVRLAPNLGWRELPLAAALRDRLGLGVPVHVANEADLGGLAEHVRGAATGAGTMVYLSGEVGLGAGIVVDGRPLVGAGGYAGEVGHAVVNPAGLSCACGSRGCFETEVGETALLRRVGAPLAGDRRRRVARVVAAALRGEPAAVRAVEDIGTWMGIGLTGIINTLNPQVVVLGGLFERLAPVLVPAVEAELRRRVTPAPLEGLEIRPSRFGPDAPLVGAAELAFEAILADPLSLARTLVQPIAASRSVAS